MHRIVVVDCAEPYCTVLGESLGLKMSVCEFFVQLLVGLVPCFPEKGTALSPATVFPLLCCCFRGRCAEPYIYTTTTILAFPSGFCEVRKNLVPKSGGGIDLDPELRSEGFGCVDAIRGGGCVSNSCGGGAVASAVDAHVTHAVAAPVHGTHIGVTRAVAAHVHGIIDDAAASAPEITGLEILLGGLVLFRFEHGSAAARTRIVDSQPLLDASLVKDVALATIPASRNHVVSGLEVLEADGATTASAIHSYHAAAVFFFVAASTRIACRGRGAAFGAVFPVVVCKIPEGPLDVSIQFRRTPSRVALLVWVLGFSRLDFVSEPEKEDPDGTVDQNEHR